MTKLYQYHDLNMQLIKIKLFLYTQFFINLYKHHKSISNSMNFIK